MLNNVLIDKLSFTKKNMIKKIKVSNVYNLLIQCLYLNPVSEIHAAPHFHWLWKMHRSPEHNTWHLVICTSLYNTHPYENEL